MIEEAFDDLVAQLVEHILKRSYEVLPHEVLEAAKLSIIETMGTLIAGAKAPGCSELKDLIQQWGGKGEATILVYGGKVPIHHAALLNSTMARALDFDNAMRGGMHPSASSVPTAIAVAEFVGGVSGKEFLTALALGEDVGARINLAVSDYYGFDPVGVCMVYGATAIAGRLMGLSHDQMRHAMGLALNMAAGSWQSNIDGSLAVRLIQGMASGSGILAALLARRGFTGPKQVLQGKFGHFHLFSRDQADVEVVTQGLGTRYRGVEVIRKRFPSCGATQAATQATLELAQEHGIEPEKVEKVRVRVCRRAYNLVGHRYQLGDQPEVNAQFSIGYTVANALTRRSSCLEHFTKDFVTDPTILKLAQKIFTEIDETLEQDGGRAQSAHVSIWLRNGGKFEKYLQCANGWPENPLNFAQIQEKFDECMSFACHPLLHEQREKFFTMVEYLEEVDDVALLIPLLLARSHS